MLCCAMLCYAVLCYAVLCCTVLYCTASTRYSWLKMARLHRNYERFCRLSSSQLISDIFWPYKICIITLLTLFNRIISFLFLHPCLVLLCIQRCKQTGRSKSWKSSQKVRGYVIIVSYKIHYFYPNDLIE